MALFTKKSNTIEVLEQGTFYCSECGRLLQMAEYNALVANTCQFCNKTIFTPQKIGRFFLVEPIAVGGMGSVYRAYSANNPDQKFAVKILPRNRKDDPNLLQQLQEEVEVSTQLKSHVSIANIVAAGYEDDEHYLAMEYIDGERLDQRIQRLGQLSVDEAILVGLRLLGAVAHVFSRGYLFRDMKPENVIITDDEGAFLFDFGICMRIEDADSDQGDTIMGSPIYFPPERILGEGERACSEIYSLGMVLYYAVKGENYFTSKEVMAIARQHVRHARLSNLEHKMKELDPQIAAVIDKMIRREMDKRYQSFIQVEHDLLRVLRHRIQYKDDKSLTS